MRAAGCVFAEDEAELLLAEARTPAQLEAMVARRVGGVPLEHVVGWADFCGLRIVLDEGVFVPRQRTEFMVAEAVALAGGRPHPVVLDLCCGSGAVGAAIAAGVAGLELYAADVDPVAVRCARRNIAPGAVFEGDLYDALPARLRGRVDILVANVPYVPTAEIAMMPAEARLFEPRLALDGGDDGLDLARRVAAGASRWLAPGGRLLIETSHRQAPIAAEIFAGSGLTPRVISSEELEATVVIGARPRTQARRPSSLLSAE